MSKIVTKQSLILLGSLIFALGFQYLCYPSNFLDLDDKVFWGLVTLGFIVYWTFIRIIIWIADGYKLNSNNGIIKLLNSIFSFIFALGFQYLCDPFNFLDLDDNKFWVIVALGFITYWTIVKIAIWIINGYELNINNGIIKLLISIFSFIFALGIQYLCAPHEFLHFNTEDFWIHVLGFIIYLAIIRIVIWIIDGYKLNINTGTVKLLISIFSFIFALGFQYLYSSFYLGDLEFWIAVILNLIRYWAIVGIIIWVIDGHKSSIKT